MRTKHDGVIAARAAIENYEQQVVDLETELKSIQQDQHKVEAELQTTVENLARGLLPYLDLQVIRQAGEESGALHLVALLDDLERQRQQNVNRVSQIESDERYLNRELLRCSGAGEEQQGQHEEDDDRHQKRSIRLCHQPVLTT